MDFTFLNLAGDVAFVRSDAEEASWTQEELNLHCTFPYLPNKVIENGMTILFQDPASGEWQAYEIRHCSGYASDYYQQIIAEDIAISELTDCHIQDKIELTNVTAENALRQILTGTGWNVGKVAGGVSSGDIARGSVWQNVSTIQQSWNVYIVPRVTVTAEGISARYLDIIPSEGIFTGIRLSVNKNVTDPCVTYDDTELYTAMYGYGGTYVEGTGDNKKTLEYKFGSVAWEKTADHPTKPLGQTYLEYPEMTALYGRRGKPRFGYYQNVNIKDPAILLQKTWEALKQCCKPKINITGTVADLKRLGYNDEPIRLHYMAIVEVEPFGLQFYMQIIKNTVDLLDATKTLPEIGDYIPNIIYINRDTENFATGGGKGGGRGGGRTKVDLEFSEYKTNTIDNGRQIELNAQHIAENGDILQQAGMYIDPETGVLIYAEDNVNNVGSKFRVQSDAIEAEVKRAKKEEGDLSSKLKLTADAIEAEVKRASKVEGEFSSKLKLTSESIDAEVKRATKTEGELSSSIKATAEAIKLTVKKGEVISSINLEAGSATIQADKIDIQGIVNALLSYNITCVDLSADGMVCQDITVHDQVTCDSIYASDGALFEGTTSITGLTIDSKAGEWLSVAVVTNVTGSGQTGNWAYTDANNNVVGHVQTMMLHSVTKTTKTIHYFGYEDS